MRRRALLMGGQKEFQKHLIGYYPFDVDFNDKIAPFVDLLSSGSPDVISLAPGKINNAVHCGSGTNSSLRSTTNIDRHKFAITDGINDVPYSFSLHVLIKSAGASLGAIIWEKGVSGGSAAAANSEYRINVSPDCTQIIFTKYSEGKIADFIQYTITAPPLNAWFHFVITDDTLGNVKIYINSVEQYKITTTGGTGYVKSSITPSSYVGSFNLVGVSGSGRYLEGGLDDFGMFKNYVLTQEDIDYIWNNGNPRRLKNVT